MIGALARASRVFDEPSWLAAAQRAADFIHREMWRDGRLLATYKDGRAHLNAYLDDYAFLLSALIELLQTGFRAQDLTWATEIADALLARFEDRANGGFFFTSDDHERLLLRPKPAHDNATPSGNGVAAQSLIVLGIGSPTPGISTAPSARCARSAANWRRGPADFPRCWSRSTPVSSPRRCCCCAATPPLVCPGSGTSKADIVRRS